MAGEQQLGSAVLILRSDGSQLSQGLNQAKSAAQGSFAEIDQGIQNVSKGFSGLGKLIGAAGIVEGIRLIAGALKDCVQSFADDEAASVKLQAVLAATDDAAGLTAGQMEQLAQSIQDSTGIERDQVVNAEAILSTYTSIGRDVFPQAMKAATDLSFVMGQDLGSTVRMLGRLLEDPVGQMGALTRAGIIFTAQTKDQVKALEESGQAAQAQSIILAELQKRVGGVADAMGETTQGKINKMNDALKDLKETIGGLIAPTIVTGLTNLTAALNAMSTALKASAGDLDSKIAQLQKVVDTTEKWLAQNSNSPFAGQWRSQLQDYLAQLRGLEAQRSAKGSSPGQGNWWAGATGMAGSAQLVGAAVPATQAQIDAAQKAAAELNKKYAELLQSLETPEQKRIEKLKEELAIAQQWLAMPGGTEQANQQAKDVIKKLADELADAMKPKFAEAKGTYSLSGFSTMENAGTAGAPSGGIGGSGLLGSLLGPVGMLVSAFASLIEPLRSVQQLMNPINTILQAMMSVLGPAINNILAPLVGILKILGETIGQMLLPIVDALGPVLYLVGQGFVLVYNYAILPFANAVIFVGNLIYNGIAMVINGIIWAINALLGWLGVNIGYLSLNPLNSGQLNPISMSTLSAAGGAGSSGSSGSGAGASYQQAAPTYITVNIEGANLYGAGNSSLAEFATLIYQQLALLGTVNQVAGGHP